MPKLLSRAEYRCLACAVMLSEHDELLQLLGTYTNGLFSLDEPVSDRAFVHCAREELDQASDETLSRLRHLLLQAMAHATNDIGGDRLGCQALIQKLVALETRCLPELFALVSLGLQCLAVLCVDWAVNDEEIDGVMGRVEPYTTANVSRDGVVRRDTNSDAWARLRWRPTL